MCYILCDGRNAYCANSNVDRKFWYKFVFTCVTLDYENALELLAVGKLCLLMKIFVLQPKLCQVSQF